MNPNFFASFDEFDFVRNRRQLNRFDDFFRRDVDDVDASRRHFGNVDEFSAGANRLTPLARVALGTRGGIARATPRAALGELVEDFSVARSHLADPFVSRRSIFITK